MLILNHSSIIEISKRNHDRLLKKQPPILRNESVKRNMENKGIMEDLSKRENTRSKKGTTTTILHNERVDVSSWTIFTVTFSTGEGDQSRFKTMIEPVEDEPWRSSTGVNTKLPRGPWVSLSTHPGEPSAAAFTHMLVLLDPSLSK